MSTSSVTYRKATQDELERTGSTTSANLIDGAGAVLREGGLIGLTNEYGTAIYTAPGVDGEHIERIAATCGEVFE